MRAKFVYASVVWLLAVAWFSPAPKPQPKPAELTIEPLPPLAQLFKTVSTSDRLLEQAKPGGKCNLEFVSAPGDTLDTIASANGKPVVFAGWSMDAASNLSADEVILRLRDVAGSSFFAFPRTGLAREDVRKHFDLPKRMTHSGFDIQLDFAGIPKGAYELDLILKFGQQSFSCGNGRKITVQ